MCVANSLFFVIINGFRVSATVFIFSLSFLPVFFFNENQINYFLKKMLASKYVECAISDKSYLFVLPMEFYKVLY